MKKVKIILITMALCLLTACQHEPDYQLYSNQEINCGFDTLCSLNAYTTSQDEFDHYFEIMVDEFARYNALFDIYNDYEGINNIKTINDNAGIKPVAVDKAIIEMLQLAAKISELSDGAFDVTDGALLRVWHNYRDEGKLLNSEGEYGNLPSEEELATASSHSGFDKIIIDEEAGTVYITDPEVSLDVGGIAKGFAAEKVAEKLIDEGLKYGAVNAGGNQRIINTKADGTGYNVGIQDPRAQSLAGIVSNSNIAIIPDQKNVSVVTSGDYQNYYYAEGDVRMAHIIDPSTLYPATHYYSVTVVTPDSGLADCLSTALFVLDYDDGLALIDKINNELDTDLIVVWISEKPLDDSSIRSAFETEEYITVTDNFKDHLITE